MGDRSRWTFRHDLPGESDEELTDRTREGDAAAFGELYRRHRKAAESAAWCLLRSKPDADDVVADAFTGVLAALHNGHGPRDNFRAYLLACVRNGCRVRRAPATPMSEDQLERWSPALEDPERYVEAGTVARAFSSLAPRWQQTLWLTEVEQRPTSEVSRQLELSPNATAALTRRARQAFATAYLGEHVATVTDQECARFAPQLASYVRNQLADTPLIALERHLVSCPACAGAVVELQDVNASLRSLVPLVAFAPGAIAETGIATEVSFAAATSISTTSTGLSGGLVLLKGLVAVLLVAPVLSSDRPPSDHRLQHPAAVAAPVSDAPLAVTTTVTTADEVDEVNEVDEPMGARPTNAAGPDSMGEPTTVAGAGLTGSGSMPTVPAAVEIVRALQPMLNGLLVGALLDGVLDVTPSPPTVQQVTVLEAVAPLVTAVAGLDPPGIEPPDEPVTALPLPVVPETVRPAAVTTPAATQPAATQPPLPTLTIPPATLPPTTLPGIAG